jgi:hypothetical protein
MKETPSIARDCLLVKKIDIDNSSKQAQEEITHYMRTQFPALGLDVAKDLSQMVANNFNKLK